MFVSRKNFLDHLKTVDYVKFTNIPADWNAVIQESEQSVTDNPDYWCSLVVEPNEFDSWDSIGDDYLVELNKFKQWGYTSTNTRSWETTAVKPKINLSWENAVYSHIPVSDGIGRPTKQQPGNIMPWHQDKFFFFKRNHPQAEWVARFIIFMKDWDLGQMLQAGNSIVSHWRAGDVIVWYPDRWHLSVNAGISSKWTTNVTGILHDEFDWPLGNL